MKRLTLPALFVWLLVTGLAGAADPPLVIDLWPGKVPGDDPTGIGEEKFIELKVNGKPYEVAGKPTKWLTNVTKPTLTVYRPAKDRDTGAAMLICPGGGYHNLGWDVEGEEVAEWLTSIGITGIILKYRCPRRAGDVKGEPPLGPLKDAQRAVSLVRSRAKEWGIDPKRIGMVGFSAGGHLVGAACTNFDKRAYDPTDDVDKISCRPDFGVMCYSGYFKVKDKDELSPTIRVTADAPPLFLVHASDDPISQVDHSVIMYLAMKRAGVSAEMHVYASGGHGFAVRKTGEPSDAWTQSCTEWLRKQGVLKPAAKRPDPPPEQTLRERIQQLGDPSFQVRNAATWALIEAGPYAMKVVREARKSSDAEVARRADRVAEQIEQDSVAALEALGACVQRDSPDGSVRSVSSEPDKANRLTDADLVHLWAFPDLENLLVGWTQVTDAGLAHVGRLAQLKELYLEGPGITDAGLAHLGGLTDLKALALMDTQVTGSGLTHLKPLTNLKMISLSGAALTRPGLEEGIAGLGELKNLTELGLGHTDLDDASLRQVKKLKSLTTLQLAYTPITDRGLAHLKALPHLSSLDVSGTAITDAGCDHLAAMKELTHLRLRNTRVTAVGLKKLEGLPGLKSVYVAGRDEMTLKEALEFLTEPAPPQFAVIKEFDKETGIVLYAEGYPNVIKEEAIVPGRDGKTTLEFYRSVTQTVCVRYSVKEGPVFDSEGKRLSAEAVLKRMAVGTTVLLSTDGKEVHPNFLKILNKDTLILVPPVQEPSPEKAR